MPSANSAPSGPLYIVAPARPALGCSKLLQYPSYDLTVVRQTCEELCANKANSKIVNHIIEWGSENFCIKNVRISFIMYLIFVATLLFVGAQANNLSMAASPNGTAYFTTVWSGLGPGGNINGSMCSARSSACEPLHNTTCEFVPSILIVTQPNCQWTRMREVMMTSPICNRAGTCTMASDFISAILVQIVTGQEPGYNSRTQWDYRGDPAYNNISVYEVNVKEMGSVYPLARFRPTLRLIPEENSWGIIYDSPGFKAGQAFVAIISGAVVIYDIVLLVFYAKTKSQGNKVLRKTGKALTKRVDVKLGYFISDILGNTLRFVLVISPMTSSSMYSWTAAQFLISFNIGFTFVGIILIPLHLFPIVSKGIAANREAKKAIIIIYIVIAGAIGAFTAIRPVATVTYSDENVRAWSGYLTFSGILFVSAIYAIVTIMDIVRIARLHKFRGMSSRTRKSLVRIAGIMSVTTFLLWAYTAVSIYAIEDKAFLRPVSLSVVTLLQLGLLSLISASHLLLFPINSDITATSTNGTSKSNGDIRDRRNSVMLSSPSSPSL
ncbi:hypothetical protein BNJ_00156 [Kaumoebavirus]|uniref:hypothetical protein n=1 Tax=Kaumoebavirus TaxID=1859492 RepID=UPI0009C1BD1F|nr:hypothetical protein BNJ_00156 [Kaumoebavirus]ARA71988.1 hypothetical protein BNJ_00156 [Kaumoebavirus]